MMVAVLPYNFAKANGVLIASQREDSVEILLREDADPSVLAELRRQIGVPLRLVGSLGQAAFDARLAESYARAETKAAEVMQDMGQDVDLLRLMQDLPTVEDLLENEDDAPIIRLINALFTQAVHERVSDIHIEPYEQYSAVRFRRDGMLREVARPHRALHAAMASRIKIMASLDIAEKRLPQDGRIALRIGQRAVDVRVSTVPTNHGERLVLRLLDKDAARLRLDALGLADDTRDRFAELLAQPHGIVLVTGPTGSGKSTTLYAALQTLDRGTRNIVTVEDPVEYDLAGIGQIQVNARVELDFARALRAILRQDPDVIMIGEIRDLETARIAVQASLTGHLVLATLHTNDAVSAVTRLVDMGIESFLLASCLRGVLAQRLVRRLCHACRRPVTAGEAEWARLDGSRLDLHYVATGCAECNGSGYVDRCGIYELLTCDERLARLIHDGAAEMTLREHGRGDGNRMLFEDGVRLLADGTTSLDELLRVASEA
jgi:general secretion pathway protein E